MLYHLFHYLQEFDVPGARLFDYITFRAGFALILSLFIAMVFGKKIIERLQLMQVGEIVRNLGLEGQMQKKGTPTMGGIIIIISILVPCLLLGKLNNVYMLLMIEDVLDKDSSPVQIGLDDMALCSGLCRRLYKGGASRQGRNEGQVQDSGPSGHRLDSGPHNVL